MKTLATLSLIFLCAIVSPAHAQRPPLFLLDSSRLEEIRSLVTIRDTPHFQAFEAMKTRIDPGNPLLVAGSYPNYKRAFYAREAAFLYLLTGEQLYADHAWQALDDIYNSTDPEGIRRPDNGSGLNRSQTLSSFAIAWNWAYEGWTQSQRDGVMGKILSGLETYDKEALSHSNITSPWASNWNGVVAGGMILTLVAADLKEEWLVDYQKSRSILEGHFASLGDMGWHQEGEFYFSLSMENALPALLAMKHTGDASVVDTFTSRNLHRIIMQASQFGPEQTSLTWGVGNGSINAAGTTSALLGLVPSAELPYYKWHYDHFRGIHNPAEEAEKYDPGHAGAVLFLIYYPETLPALNPTTEYPGVLEDSLGGYVLRSGWQDQDDFVMSLWTDSKSYGAAWNQADAFHFNIMAYGAKWGSGPGITVAPMASTLSSLHVDQAAPEATSSGGAVARLQGRASTYVIADGGNAYAGLGLDGVQRHLLTDFSGSDTVVGSMVDVISSSQARTYGWNLHLPNHDLQSGTEAGFPWFQATDPVTGAWLKAWCLTPGAVVDANAPSGYARFDVGGDTLDLWVVFQVGAAQTSPALLQVLGSGLDSIASVGGRSLSYDQTAKELHSSGALDLRIMPEFEINPIADSGRAPAVVDFSVSGTDLTGLSFDWYFEDGTTAEGSSVSRSYAADGTYQVTVVASDTLGVQGRRSTTVFLGNKAPQAAFTSSETKVLPGETVSFDASASSDPEGGSLTFVWDFGDGLPLTGETVSYSWQSEGKFDVVLKVTDSEGKTAAAKATIQVTNQEPVPDIRVDVVGGIAPFTVHFDASGSYDPEGAPLTYIWNFQDGSPVVTRNEPTVSHTFTTPGSYLVELVVEDPAGKSGDMRFKNGIHILDPADLKQPVTPEEGTYGSGLNYAVYSGPMNSGSVPDFTLLSSITDGRVSGFDVNVSPLEERFAIRFTGYLLVEETEVYYFHAHTNDRFRFLMGGDLLMEGGKTQEGTRHPAYLEAGLHPIAFEYAYDDAGAYNTHIPFIHVKWRKSDEATFRYISPTHLFSDYSVLYPSFRVSPGQGADGTEFHFEATMPSPDGLPMTYLWDFGDGGTSTSRKVSHTYTLPSNKDQVPYKVRLTITDSSGSSRTTGRTLLVSRYAHTIGRQAQDFGGLEEYGKDENSAYPFDRREPADVRPFAEAINKARESGTRVTVYGEWGHRPARAANDGNYGTTWGYDGHHHWIQFTFESGGQLQPYNITQYAFTLHPYHWSWAADPDSWDIYGSNLSDPAPLDMTAGAANADWEWIDSVPSQQYWHEDYSNGTKDRGPANHRSFYFSLPNEAAYAHYVFHIRNESPLLIDWMQIAEIQLFDYRERPEAGNSPPAIVLETPVTTAESPFTVHFDASNTTDAEGDALYYRWDFGDGQFSLPAENNSVLSHTYLEPGLYTATLEVSDGHGAASTVTREITVTEPTLNTPPQAAFSATATSIVAGEPVSFDASATVDPDGDSFVMEWELGDGLKGSGEVITHTFHKDGLYNVLLRVRDARGAVGLAAEQIHVAHPNEGRPVISFNFGPSYGGYMDPGIGAGVIPAGYWNTTDRLETVLDSYGRPTGVDWTAFDREKPGDYVDNGANAFDGNARMMQSHAFPANSRDEWTFTVANVPYGLYDVYVYYNGFPVWDPQNACSFTVGSETYWIPSSNFDFTGSFLQSTARTVGEMVGGSNYAVFEGLTAPTLDLIIDVPGPHDRARISGLQIVDKSEPGPPVVIQQPESTGVIEGTTASFSVFAYANPEGAYQWLRNGMPVAGADAATYSFVPALADDGALFTCEITNVHGSVTTDAAVLTVVPADEAQMPVILDHPLDLTAEESSPATFSVTASGVPAPVYQWFRDGVLIPDATASDYTLIPTLADSGATFNCVVTNPIGEVVSEEATLTVIEADFAPIIIRQPEDMTRRENRLVTFSILAEARPAPTYQWRMNGADIPGATGAEYTHQALLEHDGAQFTCLVSNSEGTVLSDPATLTVTASGGPQVNGILSVNFELPDENDTIEGEAGFIPVSFWNNLDVLAFRNQEVAALVTSIDGDSPVRLIFDGDKRGRNADGSNNNRMLKGGIGGSQQATVSLTNLDVAYPDGFSLYVYALEDSTKKRKYHIDNHPEGPFFASEQNSEFDGTFTRITATSESEAGGGEYAAFHEVLQSAIVLRSTPVDGGRSMISGLQIVPAGFPRILQQPEAKVAEPGEVVTFSVEAVGSPLPAYQWRRNGIEIGGETNPHLSFVANLSDDGTLYDCVITNELGSRQTDAVSLTVLDNTAPPVIITQPQSTSTELGGLLVFSIEAGGQPAPAYQWYRNGVAIDGATSSTYSRTGLMPENGAVYTCEVSNSEGVIMSEPAVATIMLADDQVNGRLSVNFFYPQNGATGEITGTAGVEPLPNWNNIRNDWSGTVFANLINSNAALSPVQLVYNGGRRDANTPVTDESWMGRLLRDAIGGIVSTTFTLTELSEAYPDGFYLYVYAWGHDAGNRSFHLDAPGAFEVFYQTCRQGDLDGSMDRLTNQTGGYDTGEYAFWETPVTGVDTLTVTARREESSGRPYISGFQIIPVRANTAPQISLVAPVAGGEQLLGLPVAFIATASDDVGVVSVAFEVDGTAVGVDSDGSDGWSFDWMPEQGGTFVLSATATDTDGAQTSTGDISFTILGDDIQLSPPVARLTARQGPGTAPLVVQFDASASSDDGGNRNGIVAFHWDFDGDGVIDESTDEALVSHPYELEGTLSPRVTVEDLDGQEDTAEVSLTLVASERVSYLAPGLASELAAAHELSDGSILIGGVSDDLSWVPPGVPIHEVDLPSGGLHGALAKRSYLLHVSGDLSELLQVWALPAGALDNLQRIRSTNVPGEPTGSLYLSGLTAAGYWVGRLNNNFVDGVPTGFEWGISVDTDEDHAHAQAWDVSADGVLVYQNGNSTACAVGFLDAQGQLIVLPELRASHLLGDDSVGRGLGGNLPSAIGSWIQFPGDLQSWSEPERVAVLPDGNGSYRMGTWPMDIFIQYNLDDGTPVRRFAEAENDYGYTGYRYGGESWVRSITVDRRTGDFYLGFNSKSRFYDINKDGGAGGEQPDFEPGVVAYARSGELKWFSRLYHEWLDDNGDNGIDIGTWPGSSGDETRISPPDQYVDSLEVDYSVADPAEGLLVVNARAHGSAQENLWEGDTIAARPDAAAFHNRFTGTTGNIHVSWIGKLHLADGTLFGATYLAGFYRKGTGNWPEVAYPEPNLDEWPSHNAGWPELTTTRAVVNTMRVDASGRVYVIGAGPRMVTTRDAWQKLPRRRGQTDPVLDEGTSPWSTFLRVYNSDLSSLNYSSAMMGTWSYPGGDISQEPEGTSNTVLTGILPLPNGLLATGYHEGDGSPYLTKGNSVRTASVPAWADPAPDGQTALFARLALTRPDRFEGFGQNVKDFLFAGDAHGTHGPHTEWAADANGDGASNLLDHAFGAKSHDRKELARRHPRMLRQHNPLHGNRELFVQYYRLSGGAGDALSSGYQHSGLGYFLEVNEALTDSGWQAASPYFENYAVLDNGDGSETVFLRLLNQEFQLPEKIFVRLRVEMD